MTPIEILALVIAVLAAIKMVVIFKNPKNWIPVVDVVYKNAEVTQFIGLVLAAVSLWYLLQVMTIVHIFAVLFFFCSLMVLSVTVMAKELLPLSRKILRQKHIMGKFWLAGLIWTVLLIWVFWALVG